MRAPKTQEQIEEILKEMGKKAVFSHEIAAEAMTALRRGGDSCPQPLQRAVELCTGCRPGGLYTGPHSLFENEAGLRGTDSL